MSIGVNLSDNDLQAIRILYKMRWAADIKNWKERDVDECMWLVSCPNKKNEILTETGYPLADVIYKLLQRVF